MKKRWAGLIMGVVLVGIAGSAAGKEGERVIENGRKISFDYTLTVDGKEVDSSKEHGSFQYTHGERSIIPGLSKQLEGLKVGDEKNIVVAAASDSPGGSPEDFQKCAR